MQFTEADKQLVAKVKRKHRAWLRFRRVFLVVFALGTALFLAVFVALCLGDMGAVAQPERSSSVKVVAIVAIWAPLSLALGTLCALGLALVLACWNIPSRELLLRLAEEHENNKN